jgi:four helix bundle protein
MKYSKTIPKSEIRNSKETRNSKFEGVSREAASEDDSEFWVWGDEKPGEAMVLSESSQVPPPPPPQDLEKRTANFGEAIIRFAKKIPQNPVNSRLIGQLVGAGTSVGANFCEASDAVSPKDFKKSIGTCRKESKESMFFLRMIAMAEPSLAEDARGLWREAKELNLIFGSIWRKGR